MCHTRLRRFHAPWIVLDAPTGDVTTQYPSIDIQFCKGTSVLDGASILIKMNGVDKTTSFSTTSTDPQGRLRRIDIEPAALHDDVRWSECRIEYPLCFDL